MCEDSAFGYNNDKDDGTLEDQFLNQCENQYEHKFGPMTIDVGPTCEHSYVASAAGDQRHVGYLAGWSTLAWANYFETTGTSAWLLRQIMDGRYSLGSYGEGDRVVLAPQIK